MLSILTERGRNRNSVGVPPCSQGQAEAARPLTYSKVSQLEHNDQGEDTTRNKVGREKVHRAAKFPRR